MPPLPADFIHARACKLKCEKILTRPCSSGQNNVVVTEFAASGFTTLGRPDIFQ
ncbi:hypothetical protein HMPREF0995_05839 [Lachnospiraceae bacterium 7_1_58FAA]|nr:hypothetical protein HMPREF0995_05839 [Lachnospiraceae bacterium 7_1_58FAA]